MVALRFPAAISTGMLVAIGLFSLLHGLISGTVDVGETIPAVVIDFTRLTPLLPTPPPVRPPEPVREQVIRPPGPTGPEIDEPEVGRGGRGERVIVPTFGTEIPPGAKTIGIDSEPLPVVRIDPDYPTRALRGEIEGWVDVQFSVTATGAVRDVVIIDAEPKNVFDAAVLEAVARWRYNPKVDQGVAVERVGMRTRILFELDRTR